MVDFELVRFPHQVAQFSGAEGARVEIGDKIGQMVADLAERHPAVFAFHLRNHAFDDGPPPHWVAGAA